MPLAQSSELPPPTATIESMDAAAAQARPASTMRGGGAGTGTATDFNPQQGDTKTGVEKFWNTGQPSTAVRKRREGPLWNVSVSSNPS